MADVIENNSHKFTMQLTDDERQLIEKHRQENEAYQLEVKISMEALKLAYLFSVWRMEHRCDGSYSTFIDQFGEQVTVECELDREMYERVSYIMQAANLKVLGYIPY